MTPQISYVQPGFQHPAFVLDPIPSVREYLDDYMANNEAWYRSFAAPLEGGGWGTRASSFMRRGVPPETKSQVNPDPGALPPIIQPGPGEDNRVLAGDQPIGAIVRDLDTMTGTDVTAELDYLTGPGGWMGSLASLAAGPGTGFGIVGGPMARSSVNDRIQDLVFESLARGLSLDAVMAEEPDRRGVTIARRGTPTVTEARETGSHQGGGPQDYERGGEDQFDAGGWRGGGGL